MKYKGYIIELDDFHPHPAYKYAYYPEDDTDGTIYFARSIEEAKQEIDEIDE